LLKPHIQSYSSAQASHRPLQSSELYESPASPYGTTYDSRPVISDSQTLGSQKPLYSAPSLGSPSPSYVSQSSELYKSPISLHSYSTHSSKPSDSQALGSQKPLYSAPSLGSPSPSYNSQSSELYKSPISLHSYSTHSSKPSESSLSHGLHNPSYGSQPNHSQKPSHNSDFTDSYESPSLHSSSHDSRISRPSQGSLFGNSSWSHTPIRDSSSSDSTITSYGSPSNLNYESPSSTFQESLSYSEGGSVDSSHTFVNTDHHGHVKWGVRHSVSNQKAGSHQ